jgi:hypothetical protein
MGKSLIRQGLVTSTSILFVEHRRKLTDIQQGTHVINNGTGQPRALATA